MENKKIKKANAGYMLLYIIGPVVVMIGLFAIGLALQNAMLASLATMVSMLLAVAWWVFGGDKFYGGKRKKAEKQLEAEGFVRNHTFYGRNCSVWIDIAHGKVALLFFWNPFETYAVSAKRIAKAWVDDGKGFMNASSRVSFLFLVDEVKVRVDTFITNRRYRMDSKEILTGISKADMVVEAMNRAKEQAV